MSVVEFNFTIDIKGNQTHGLRQSLNTEENRVYAEAFFVERSSLKRVRRWKGCVGRCRPTRGDLSVTGASCFPLFIVCPVFRVISKGSGDGES